jgi:hypothetical protein
MVTGKVGRVATSGNSRSSLIEIERAGGAMRARGATAIALRDAERRPLANVPTMIHLQFDVISRTGNISSRT